MTEWFIQLNLISQFLIIYLVIINIITFFYFGIDKIKAKFSHQRISEKTLWFLPAIGGSMGALVGMNFFKHKTRKNSFQIIIALILIIQILFCFWLLK